MYQQHKCEKCGEIDILRETTIHGMRKESFTFVDCGGTMRRVIEEPVQLTLFGEDIENDETEHRNPNL